MTAAELDELWAEIEQGRDRLHSIELEIASNLRERPLHTWCRACHRMYRRIHRKALTGGR